MQKNRLIILLQLMAPGIDEIQGMVLCLNKMTGIEFGLTAQINYFSITKPDLPRKLTGRNAVHMVGFFSGQLPGGKILYIEGANASAIFAPNEAGLLVRTDLAD